MREKYMSLYSQKGEKMIRIYILLLAVDAIFLKLSQNRLSNLTIGLYLVFRIWSIMISFVIILGEILKTFGDRFEEIVDYITNRNNLSQESKKEYRKFILRFFKFIVEIIIANCTLGVLLLSASN